MTKSIWKFPVPIMGKVRIEMPEDAKVLFAAVQHGEPCFWAEVSPDNKPIMRDFRIYGTGHRLPDDPGRYLGTFMVLNGSEVYHVYE